MATSPIAQLASVRAAADAAPVIQQDSARRVENGPAVVAPAVQPSEAAKEESGREAEAIGELVDVLRTTAVSLRFEIDESTHRVITKVIDKQTGELIRQMPTVEVLRIARAIDKLQGLFVSQAV